MKIKLGNRQIDPKRIKDVSRVGSRITNIRFKTGDSIRVICGVRSPDSGFILYKGTYELLKEFIDKHK